MSQSVPSGKDGTSRRRNSGDRSAAVAGTTAATGKGMGSASGTAPRRHTDRRRQIGNIGETAAADLLQSKGYRIIARNWRCRSGELDIVAETDGILVFVEVRTRRPTGSFGTAKEAVDARKQRQVRETAQFYLHATGSSLPRMRFDVIAVELSLTSGRDGSESCTLEHIENAF